MVVRMEVLEQQARRKAVEARGKEGVEHEVARVRCHREVEVRRGPMRTRRIEPVHPGVAAHRRIADGEPTPVGTGL